MLASSTLNHHNLPTTNINHQHQPQNSTTSINTTRAQVAVDWERLVFSKGGRGSSAGSAGPGTAVAVGAGGGGGRGGAENVGVPQSCIFKVGDDCRQDMLALQIIDVLKRVFDSVGLPLYLFPYRVVATGYGCGVIEMVPRTQSRDGLGKDFDMSLKDYFIAKYGDEDSSAFQRARENFVLSMAGYAIASFILWVKDRHNGNILVDDDGHLIHIDFGFTFSISPGGDIGFERASWKCPDEFVELMGGDRDGPIYNHFRELVIRGYLAVRPHIEEICGLVELMLDADLGCFKPHSMATLRDRLSADRSEAEAVDYMIEVVRHAERACVSTRGGGGMAPGIIVVHNERRKSGGCAGCCVRS